MGVGAGPQGVKSRSITETTKVRVRNTDAIQVCRRRAKASFDLIVFTVCGIWGLSVKESHVTVYPRFLSVVEALLLVMRNCVCPLAQKHLEREGGANTIPTRASDEE